ncbi:semaphorin-2A-like [Myzus persicae]|nr:semaphorin-2A-like [Myzus persicae]
MCTHRYDSCLRCVHDPYCGWDKQSKTCKPYQPGLLQDVTNSSRSVCESSVVNKRLTVTFGQSVHLSCFVKMPQVLKVYPVTWYHHSKEKGRYMVSFSRVEKYIATVEGGMVIVGASEEDGGRYDCQLAGALLCTFNLTVDAHRCSPPARSSDYHRVYSDWCHEFQKYKSAMKSWEKKQAQCSSSRQNETAIAQGLLSNELNASPAL